MHSRYSGILLSERRYKQRLGSLCKECILAVLDIPFVLALVLLLISWRRTEVRIGMKIPETSSFEI